ncbi:selenocysteine insertion sequence-binding protein 2 [Vombatus ursinus]|uniref:selenocysteine insertion sequence-binding protein 2 n=1 Tax=Vombatus ursinus TaxID=29139 RepID=UPI000FFD8B72|nr:selenocysteine insertion sequence-binding protein 2 [Vombatus ursinus]
MASEGKREPDNEGGIKLSADVKPFVPKYAVLNVAWSESSDACVFPNFATTCYPFVQELPVTEQKAYTEDVSLGSSSPFSSQYSSPDIAVDHQCTSSHSSVSTQNVCSVPGSQYDYNHPKCYSNVRIVKSRNEQICSLPQETKSLFKKRTTCNEQKLNNKGTEGNSSSAIKPAKGCHQIYTYTEGGSKSEVCHKRADRRPKTSRKNVSSSKPEFELKLLDFPKLQGSQNSDIPEVQKQPKWGPLSSTANDISLIREVVKPTSKEELVVKAETATSEPENDTNSPSSTRELSWTPMGYVVRPTTTEAPALKNVTSLVNTKKSGSSVTPKKLIASFSSPEVLTTNAYNKEKQIAWNSKKTKTNNVCEIDKEEMRKNKKKKNKPKANYETLMVQEPPRIEDIEEFPNLTVASERKNKLEPSKCLSKHQPESSEEIVNHILTSDRRNGPQSSKFHSKQQSETTSKKFGKKSQIPVKLDLGGMLAALEKKQHSQNSKQSSKPIVVSVGAVPVLSKELATSVKNHRLNQMMSPHNPLDSSSPLIKKGKQREVPKAKKPTSLKKIILKEREERKQKHLLEQLTVPAFAQKIQQDLANNINNKSADQVAQPDFEQIEETEESVPNSSTVEVENTLEEPLGERQQDAEVCPIVTQPVPPFPKIHSRRFRDYCSQMLSKEVDDCVMDLLKELVRFQDRMYQKDPVKAKTKRRLVMGLREVLKHLKLKKLKCVIISPNCEKSKSKGGLDETLHTIIDYACEQNVPFVFALNRKALGRSVNKVVPVSVVGIFSYDGAQDQFRKMIELTMEARQAYKVMLATLKEGAEALDMENPLPPSLPPQGQSCSSELSKTTDTTKEEEPNYIKIWKKNLEEYNPYALELEKTSTTEMLNLNL